jgi:hypothetical protein
MTPLILRLDISGSPVRWIPWQLAVSLYSREMIAWTAGNSVFTFRGGISRLTGERSTANICMYCGNKNYPLSLTRDHVVPLSKGGKDQWSNVVTACRNCNIRKGNRTPENAHMPLLAIPYVPNWAEYLALSNRKILADQMEFLKTQFSGRKISFFEN